MAILFSDSLFLCCSSCCFWVLCSVLALFFFFGGGGGWGGRSMYVFRQKQRLGQISSNQICMFLCPTMAASVFCFKAIMLLFFVHLGLKIYILSLHWMMKIISYFNVSETLK